MRCSGFLALVGALLFTAACAWGFNGLYGAISGAESVPVEPAAERAVIRLTGIAVRSERLIGSARISSVSAADGERVPCGAPLASGLTAPCSAVYYADFDALEYLTPEHCRNLTVPSLQKLLDSAPAPTGSAAGRLVTDYVWYYAALTEDAAKLETGRCTLLFDGFESGVSARLLSVSEAQDGLRAVLLRLTCGGDYLKLRRTGAELIL